MDSNDNYILVLLKEISTLLLSGNLAETFAIAILLRTITNDRIIRNLYVLLLVVIRIINMNENPNTTNESTNNNPSTTE
ncbi:MULTISPECIES: hypothetical protein [unclassified Bacillus (in: firmicutes)]|uniref:hypothetical protein n=1 Tax=unclassified Bacillus (in: firmicutes) TaxID=185979 RepID=UPI000BF12EDB|nr:MULTISPECIES: hypothetical protein [unclassified Bacillus (in: firmicutes)]PEJ53123.1 hypothetical protein CN692_21660 [Bacillus sp. AFS002410]PEL13706.1 hypothetical protein CN601_03060 [Bacillus sp. AFS017336]